MLTTIYTLDKNLNQNLRISYELQIFNKHKTLIVMQKIRSKKITHKQANPALNSDAKGFRSLRSLHPFAPVRLALS